MKNSIRLQIKFVNLVFLIFLMFCDFLMGQIRVNQHSLTQTDGKYSFNGNLFTGSVYDLSDNHQLKNEFQVINGFVSGQSVFYVKKENFDKNKFVDTILVQKYQNQINLLSQEINDFKKDSLELKTSSDDLFYNKIGGLDKFYDLEEKNNKGKLKGEKKENYDNYFSFKNRIEENKKKLLSKRSEFSSVKLKLSQEKGKNIFENTKSELITFKDNNKNGLYEKYEKSKIIETGNYSNNQKNGEWKTHDSYGKLTKLETYKYNKKNGKYQEFQNDKLITEGQYKDNLKEGEWTLHSPNYKEFINYLNGLKEGIYEKKSSNQINILGSYLKDLKNGEWKEISPDGKLISLSTFLDDNLNGSYKKYDVIIFDNSDWDNNDHTISFKGGEVVEVEGEYVNNLMNGDWIYRGSDDRIRAKGKFQNGDGTGLGWQNVIPTNGRNGFWICYYYGMAEFERIKNILKEESSLIIDPNSDFEIQEKSNWINGSCEGRTTYSIDGKKRVEIDYFKGLRNGKFIVYRENGTIELETQFKNGLCEFEGNYFTKNKDKFEYKNGKWEKELTDEERFAKMQRQVEEMNKKADILEQQINEQLERQNSSNNTRSNSSYTKTEKNDTESCSRCKGTGVCKECGKPQRVRYYKNGWREDEETRIGKTVCSTCHGDGTIDEHISLNSNKIDRYENCYYSSCYSGWVKCRRCYGKGKCDLCHGSGKKK